MKSRKIISRPVCEFLIDKKMFFNGSLIRVQTHGCMQKSACFLKRKDVADDLPLHYVNH